MAYDGFFLTHKNDADAKMRFRKLQEKLPGMTMIVINKDTWENNTLAIAVFEISQTVNTRYFWIVDPDTLVHEDFDFLYEPTEWNKDILHYWNCNERNDANRVVGVKLYRTKNVLIDDYVNKSYYLDVPNHTNETHLPTYSPIPEKYDICYANDVKELDRYASIIDTTMFWIVDSHVSPYLHEMEKFFPSMYEHDIIHNFSVKLPSGVTVTNGIRLVPKKYDLSLQKDMDFVMGELTQHEIVYARTIEAALETATSYPLWVVNPDLDLLDTNVMGNFYPNIHDNFSAYVFKIQSNTGNDLGHGGLMFVTKNYNSDSINWVDRFAMVPPNECRIPIYRSRDPYDVYCNKSKNDYFYWYVDTIVSPLDTFNFDFYPDIHSLENVFMFDGAGGGSSVYLVNRPHLEKFELTEDDFSFDRFKNIKHVETVVSRPISHPVFYFDEGMYSANTEYMRTIPDIEIIDASDLQSAYQEAATKTKTGHFWAIDNDVSLIDINFSRSYFVDRHKKSHFMLWPKENPYTGLIYQFGGVKLCPSEAILHLQPDAHKIRTTNFSNKVHVKTTIARSRDIRYDTIFLSYNEPFADENYEKLLKRIPNAKRVHGVKGIFNAHKKAAEVAETKMFYVVDADAILLDEFEFEYFPNFWEEDIVHTWRSKNPINGLVYGYGGLKLFPTMHLRNATDWKVDFTTSVSEKFKPMQIVANYTAFNTDPFNTWKSAFRECTKLSANIIQRGDSIVNNERLNTWCNVGIENPFGEYAIAGAKMGKAYGTKYSTSEVEISKINDFDWLKAKFEETYNDDTDKRTQSTAKLKNKKA